MSQVPVVQACQLYQLPTPHPSFYTHWNYYETQHYEKKIWQTSHLYSCHNHRQSQCRKLLTVMENGPTRDKWNGNFIWSTFMSFVGVTISRSIKTRYIQQDVSICFWSMLFKFPVTFTFKTTVVQTMWCILKDSSFAYMSLCSQVETLLIKNSLFNLCSKWDSQNLSRFSSNVGPANISQHWLPSKTTSSSPFFPLPRHRFIPSFLWQGNVVT